MLLEVRIVFTLVGDIAMGREHEGDFWCAGKVLFLDFGVGDMAVFSL